MPNDVLLNINVQAEKMIWQRDKTFELIGGMQIQAGTMFDDASLHVQIRIGNMQPYFNSYIGQYASASNTGGRRLQYYFFIKPAAQWWAYNALLQGGVFSGKGSYYEGVNSKDQSPSLKRITATVDAGLVLVVGNVSLSFIQKQISSLIYNVSDQTVGNISLTVSW
jgi:hypothetical protein